MPYQPRSYPLVNMPQQAADPMRTMGDMLSLSLGFGDLRRQRRQEQQEEAAQQRERTIRTLYQQANGNIILTAERARTAGFLSIADELDAKIKEATAAKARERADEREDAASAWGQAANFLSGVDSLDEQTPDGAAAMQRTWPQSRANVLQFLGEDFAQYRDQVPAETAGVGDIRDFLNSAIPFANNVQGRASREGRAYRRLDEQLKLAKGQAELNKAVGESFAQLGPGLNQEDFNALHQESTSVMSPAAAKALGAWEDRATLPKRYGIGPDLGTKAAYFKAVEKAQGSPLTPVQHLRVEEQWTRVNAIERGEDPGPSEAQERLRGNDAIAEFRESFKLSIAAVGEGRQPPVSQEEVQLQAEALGLNYGVERERAARDAGLDELDRSRVERLSVTPVDPFGLGRALDPAEIEASRQRLQERTGALRQGYAPSPAAPSSLRAAPQGAPPVPQVAPQAPPPTAPSAPPAVTPSPPPPQRSDAERQRITQEAISQITTMLGQQLEQFGDDPEVVLRAYEANMSELTAAGVDADQFLDALRAAVRDALNARGVLEQYQKR